MVKPSTIVVIAGSAVLGLLLGACGGDQPSGLPSASQQPSTVPSSAPTTPVATTSTPRATPTAIPTETTQKYGALTLVLRRPAGTAAGAVIPLGLFDRVNRSFAVIAAGGKRPADLSLIAAPNVVKYIEDTMAKQRKAGERSAGTLAISVKSVQAGASVAIVSGCFDQARLTTVRPNGSTYVDASIGRNPKLGLQVALTKATGVWKVNDYLLKAGGC